MNSADRCVAHGALASYCRWARWRALLITGLLLAIGATTAQAQYFGRNKVQYRTFDFRVLPTEHFDIYYYPEEAEAARIVGRMAERWYARLSRFFSHDLRGRQPLILYASAAHFKQTNAVEGAIGEGTGGVTEALKRRIVLPMAGTLADTDHVLGHELVHAFQFDITGADPRDSEFSLPDILQYPLWFAEGMAEYLSIGPIDAQTAMWLRDAALSEKLPHIKDLNDPRLFPYRWGHAFWAFIGAKYGDRAVSSLLRSAANPRFDMNGLAAQLGSDPDRLTEEWHDSILRSMAGIRADLPALTSTPRLLIDESRGGGRLNVGPRVSPDGSRVAFFSERDRFSVDLYLAETTTGRIERKLISSATDPHFDSLQFLQSGGAWRPDGRQIVLTAVRRGRPTLAFVDPDNGRITREIVLHDLDDALGPSWAPDGRSLVVAGNRGGLFDLYLVSLPAGTVTPLTQDPFADLEPVFTPDGRHVVFVSERFSTDLDTLRPGALQLAVVDVETRAVRALPAFLRGKHLSPQVSRDGRHVAFVADPDGISNLYRIALDGGPVLRLTAMATGIAGITTSSPALSSATETDRLAFSVFERDGHSVYLLDPADTVEMVSPLADQRAAALTPEAASGRPSGLSNMVTGDIRRLLADPERGLPPRDDQAVSETYRRPLTLDVVSQPTITAGVDSFGTFVGGSVSAFFSDMLGDRLLSVGAHVAGDIDDLGAQVSYISRRHRWNWAASLESIPYRVGYLTWERDTAAGTTTLRETIDRQTYRGGSFITAFPFSQATRVEVAAGAHAVSFTRDIRDRVYDTATEQFLERREIEEKTAASLGLVEFSSAFVHDTSFAGPTSPIVGSRYRMEMRLTRGSLQFHTALFDWRKYVMPVQPVTVAVRVLHFGRYGGDAEHPQLARLYAGHQELVHGYGFGSYEPGECTAFDPDRCRVFDRLMGSRVAVANAEVRAPVIGLIKGELEYGSYVPLELAVFFDAGVAWSSGSRPALLGGTRDTVRSYGAALRANLFGLLTLELARSRAIDRAGRPWKWQLGIVQGF
ncbi:MAG: BamA/TamA family outer membrane protein [Vicinamibacterales bacterium]